MLVISTHEKDSNLVFGLETSAQDIYCQTWESSKVFHCDLLFAACIQLPPATCFRYLVDSKIEVQDLLHAVYGHIKHQSTASASRAVRRAGRHARVPFTGAQAAALEAAYARAPYLAPPALKALAQALQLRDDRIKIWFQNRRARERREKSTTIAPPNSITLLPTTSAPRIPQTSSQFSPTFSQPVLTIAQRRTICQWQQCTVVGNNNHIDISSLASRMHSSRLDRPDLIMDNSDCSDSSVDVENVDD